MCVLPRGLGSGHCLQKKVPRSSKFIGFMVSSLSDFLKNGDRCSQPRLPEREFLDGGLRLCAFAPRWPGSFMSLLEFSWPCQGALASAFYYPGSKYQIGEVSNSRQLFRNLRDCRELASGLNQNQLLHLDVRSACLYLQWASYQTPGAYL